MRSTRQGLQQEFFEAVGFLYRSMAPVKNRFLGKLGLNRSQIEVMGYIFHNKNTTIKDISRALNITSSAATQLTEGLVQLGFLKREHDKKDRRIVHVFATKKGKSKFMSFKKVIHTKMASQLQTITDKELQTMTTIAKKIAMAKSKK